MAKFRIKSRGKTFGVGHYNYLQDIHVDDLRMFAANI